MEDRNLPYTEIIHCKDCEFKKLKGVDYFCDHIGGEEIMVYPNDYCSWAKIEETKRQTIPSEQQAAGDTISRQVTMDAQQERTGYWFFSTTDFKTHCSACKQSEWHGYIPTPEEALKWMPICPKCGARMKESEIRTKKVRPATSVELDYGNDGRDCRYYVDYKCPTCGKSMYEGTVACDRCGTFFDWSKKASIKEIRKIEWE